MGNFALIDILHKQIFCFVNRCCTPYRLIILDKFQLFFRYGGMQYVAVAWRHL